MKKQYGLLFLLLALPALAYIFYVTFAQNNYKKLPVFGPKEAFSFVKGGKVDTIYYQLHPLEGLLTNQQNKVMVLSFFPEKDVVNNRIRYKQLARVEDVFKKNPLIWLVNVSQVEDSNAAKYKTIFPRKIELENAYSPVPALLMDKIFTYEPDWVALKKGTRLEELSFLVDHKLRVRGIYRTVIRTETDKLMEDIRTLIVEYANTEPKRR